MVIYDLSDSEGTIKSVFQTKNECCSRNGDVKKGFLLDCSDNVKWLECGRKNSLTKQKFEILGAYSYLSLS